MRSVKNTQTESLVHWTLCTIHIQAPDIPALCAYTCLYVCPHVHMQVCIHPSVGASPHTFDLSDSSISSLLICEGPFDCRLLEEAARKGEASSLAFGPVLVVTNEWTEGLRDRRFYKQRRKCTCHHHSSNSEQLKNMLTCKHLIKKDKSKQYTPHYQHCKSRKTRKIYRVKVHSHIFL